MKRLLSLLYGFCVFIRNWLYDKGICQEHTSDIPTISVGNVAVGGTGKTPQTEYLLQLLSERFKVAYLSRGYKRSTHGFVLADDNSNDVSIGDEAMQVHMKFPAIPIAVDEDRLHGIALLQQHIPDLQVVILDDALQHRQLRAGLNLLLTRADNLYVKDYFLPYGRLRDSITTAGRANMIVVTDCPRDLKPIDKRLIEKELHILPYQQLFFTAISYGTPYPLFAQSAQQVAEIEKGNGSNKSGVALLTAIANPMPLYNHLKQQYPDIRLFSFADHHKFSKKDLDALKYRTQIFTTEKDAARLLSMSELSEQMKARFFVVPIEIEFLDKQQEKQFNNKIIAYVTESNRNS